MIMRFPGFVIVARTRRILFDTARSTLFFIAMTSLMHASTGPDIKVASGNLPLAPCGFARHANIARVCGTHAATRLATSIRHRTSRCLPPQDYLGVMSY